MTHVGRCTKQANEQAKYDQTAPFVQKIVHSTTAKDKKAAVHGMIDMIGKNARPMGGRGRGSSLPPGGGRDQGLTGSGRGNLRTETVVKVTELESVLKKAVVEMGACLGHAQGNCLFVSMPSGCKFPHLSDAELHRLAKDVVRKKSAVELMTDGKKDSVKDNTQGQGKTAPAMAAASDNSAAINKFMTEFLNEVSFQNGASAISEHGMRGFGLGFYATEEEIMVVMEAGNIHVIEDEIIGVMDTENPFMIEEECTVTMSAPNKPKRFKLGAPVRLIRSDKMADRSGNRKAKKHMTRKHVRSDGLVLNFDEIVPEEGADMEKGNGKRKARYYVFRLRRLGHNGCRLRFRTDDDGWVTVMKGPNDAEREITIPVYNATYNGKGINHRTNARSMTRQFNNLGSRGPRRRSITLQDRTSCRGCSQTDPHFVVFSGKKTKRV
jgi:hypothetical protein